MTPTEYLNASKDFAGGERFASLLSNGLAILGMSYRQFAREVEVIPSTVSRWASGAAKPLVGMQKLAVTKLRKNVLRVRTRSRKPV
jgi:ribosome-binding protein aMBF1 (putative translation factor)